jgi:uncharacterized LabA/DUF88 family protein
MARERVAVYVDGFNLYHALCGLKADHLKWVNLFRLGKLLTRSQTQTLVQVNYFSAFADHLKGTEKEGSIHRHRAYVAALEAKGVRFVEGNFARRKWHYRGGPRYRSTWSRHEEKQTDVAIGVHVIADAYRDVFDTALIVSADTDLLPVFKMMADQFPEKRAVTVATPERAHHQSLIDAAAGHQRIKRSQIEKALFGKRVMKNGRAVAIRPTAYRPPG